MVLLDQVIRQLALISLHCNKKWVIEDDSIDVSEEKLSNFDLEISAAAGFVEPMK